MTPLPHGGSVVVVGVVLAQVAGCGLHRRMSLSMSCRVGLVLETACAVIVVVPFFLPFFFKGTVAVKVWQAESTGSGSGPVRPFPFALTVLRVVAVHEASPWFRQMSNWKVHLLSLTPSRSQVSQSRHTTFPPFSAPDSPRKATRHSFACACARGTRQRSVAPSTRPSPRRRQRIASPGTDLSLRRWIASAFTSDPVPALAGVVSSSSLGQRSRARTASG